MIMMIVFMCFLIITCPCIDEMSKIKSIMGTNVNACDTVYIITVDVTNAVTHLKTGKSDDSEDLKSDNFINGTNNIFYPMVLVLIE